MLHKTQPGGREARVNEQRPSTKQLASAGARGACSEAVRGLPRLATLELQVSHLQESSVISILQRVSDQAQAPRIASVLRFSAVREELQVTETS